MSTERETSEPGLSPADPGSDRPTPPAAEGDVTAHLVPHFPGEERGTGVVLYGAARGVLRVQWRLEPDTLEQVVGSFPVAGARPALVLRLRRLRPDGGSDQLDEVRLAAVARSGSGFREFTVPVDHGRYRADLGLINEDGGWLMLARSNDLDNVAQVGVDLSHLAAAVPRAAVRAAPLSPIALDPTQSVGKPADQRPTDARPVPIFPLALRLIAEHTGDSPPGAGSIPPTEPASPAPVALLVCAVPTSPAGGTADDVTLGVMLHTDAQECPVLREMRAPGEGEDEDEDGDRAGSPEYPPLPVRPVFPEFLTAAEPEAAEPVNYGPIAPLSYGQEPVRSMGVQILAELRISGQAAPGTEIDLFGHPYRVGPGGRFQLVVLVDDPELLRRALDLHPPPQLREVRDD
ncbi:hypothetical protein [uncultured Lamprocystis sp.]|uniref:hypothetical protein n=1 Tax=uncultured Lamprocystis sp. TaxID=543132 RepID=UPI0025DAD41F|nr:hypothetical protein [uncultured Lamprocystis sp.]